MMAEVASAGAEQAACDQDASLDMTLLLGLLGMVRRQICAGMCASCLHAYMCLHDRLPPAASKQAGGAFAHGRPSPGPPCTSRPAAALTYEQQQEGLVVGMAYAVVDPGAVVVLQGAQQHSALSSRHQHAICLKDHG